MSPPIREGSGNDIGAIRLGDGTEISEVRTGAGDGSFSAIPDSGVARCTLDDADTSGSTAEDVVNQNDGTINGVTTGVSGANQTYTTNEAYDFDGSNDTVELGNQLDADISAPLSVALWVNSDDITTKAAFIDHDDTRFTIAQRERQTTKPTVHFSIFDGSVQNVVESTRLTSDTWNFYCATYDGSTMELFKNDANSQGTATAGKINDTGDGTVIGGKASGADFFNGAIDDVQIYSKVLTPTEVSNLYNTGTI